MSEACPRCKGTGMVEHYTHVAKGLCFKCYGTGTTNKEEIAEAKAFHLQQHPTSQEPKPTEVEELKTNIAVLYNTIQKSRLVKANEQRRKEAKIYFNRLKQIYGITLTLEDIKGIAETI